MYGKAGITAQRDSRLSIRNVNNYLIAFDFDLLKAHKGHFEVLNKYQHQIGEALNYILVEFNPQSYVTAKF